MTEREIGMIEGGSYLENLAIVARGMKQKDVAVPLDAYCEMLNRLKKQEPVKPVRHGAMWYCGNCDSKLVRPHYDAASYCWKCGKAVDWSGRTAQD